jgi:hypothetical protein
MPDGAVPKEGGMARIVADFQAELADREAIRDCLMRYSRGIDRRDPELLRGVYWPGAVDEHLDFVGTGEDFIDYVIPALSRMDQTMHLLGNILIDIQGDEASVETYFQAFHRLRLDGEERRDFEAAGRYVDRFAKRDDEWRIARRVVIIDWFRAYPDSADWSNGVLGNRTEPGGHKPDDRSYALLGWA